MLICTKEKYFSGAVLKLKFHDKYSLQDKLFLILSSTQVLSNTQDHQNSSTSDTRGPLRTFNRFTVKKGILVL